MAIYIFFSCEGWLRFGPYEFVSFRGEDTLLDESGDLIATRLKDEWVATDRDGNTVRNLSDPVFSSQPRHNPGVRNRSYWHDEVHRNPHSSGPRMRRDSSGARNKEDLNAQKPSDSSSHGQLEFMMNHRQSDVDNSDMDPPISGTSGT